MLQLKDIIIDEEFRDFLPTVEDASLLRGKIELEGWSDEPITVWMPHAILLDGHRRYEIWQERGDDGPQVREMTFATREAAFYWVKNNQRARRNLTPEQDRYLAGHRYAAEVDVKGAPEGNQNAKKQKAQNEPFVSKTTHQTAQRIGKEHGMGQSAVRRAANYANAVDELDKRGVIPKSELLSGAVKVPASKVIEASKASTNEEAKDVITSAKKGEKKTKPKTQNSDRLKPHRENTLEDSERACEAIEHAVAELEKMKLNTLNEKDAATLHDNIFSIRTRITRIISLLKDHSNGKNDSEKTES